MSSVNSVQASTQGYQTPRGDETPGSADKTSTAAQVLQGNTPDPSHKSLKDRMGEPKGFKQLLDDGVAVLKEVLVDKRRLITKERILFVALVAATIAAVVLLAPLSILIPVAIGLKLDAIGCSTVALLSSVFASVIGTLVLDGAILGYLITMACDRNAKIDQTHSEIDQYEKNIAYAQVRRNLPGTPKDSTILHLEQFAQDPQVQASIQKQQADNERKDHEWLVQFVQKVDEEKTQIEAKRLQPGFIAKMQPKVQKLYRQSIDWMHQQTKEGAPLQVGWTKLRRSCSQGLKHLSVAIQP